MASIAQAVVTCAPGNLVSVPATGFTLGAGTCVVAQQGGHADTSTNFDATIVPNIVTAPGAPPQLVTFTVPDRLTSGPALVMDSAVPANSANVSIRVVSQYVQTYEYVGEGADTASLAAGELDAILQRASGYVDAYIGGTVRAMQTLERHHFEGNRRFWPMRKPIISVDAIQYVTSTNLRTTFNITSDIYVNPTDGYVDILAFALGNYTLLGAIESLGFAANVVEILITAGYSIVNVPPRLFEATILVATKLLEARRMNKFGLAGLAAIKNGLIERDPKPFDIPQPAKTLLRSFAAPIMR